ncbi:MAG: Trx7/PDZ domain-containing (seleno)protein [Aureliella sp.]
MKQFALLLTLLLFPPLTALAEDDLSREEKVRLDKKRVEAEGFWLYNDLDQAYEVARETGKPILVVLRCLPCEECVKLDDELVDNDPAIRPLLEQFVCVRVVGTNGLDLNVFQYDTDQSFAVFMLNADKTIYGRFGTRSHRTEWLGDVSLTGMANALRGALELHKDYPANASALAGKTGRPLEKASPEKYPTLAGKFTDSLNYEGDVVKSCIHCHQIGEARREFYWNRGEPIPEKLFYSYPHPKSIGLILDPNQRATVKEVKTDSIASQSGLTVGDEILTMQQQPLLSMADVQWVLHNTPATATEIPMRVRRAGKVTDVSLALPDRWRQNDDISWRVSSWTLCRIATGGMRLETLTDQERKEKGISNPMALRVRSAGRYGPHGAARRAGFRVDDIVIAFDGQDDLLRESDVFSYVNHNLRPGKSIPIKIMRNGKTRELSLKIQK